MTLYELKTNKTYNSLEVFFTEKPDEKTREILKARKFRWNPKRACWYGFADHDELKAALDGVAVIPEASFVDGGGLYDGWQGGNNRKWGSDKELKAFLMDDFKKAGIKASVRFNRAGYLTSITTTITIKSEDLKTYEEFKEGYDFYNSYSLGGWLYYTDENGDIKDINIEKLMTMEGTEKAELIENITRTAYDRAIKGLDYDSCGYGDNKDILRDAAANKYLVVKKIVASYNRDCSNSQVDYFDRDIYDHYRFKIA